MEANRDGAMDCLMKAKALLRQGHVDEARRLANKSKKMYSTTDCDAFIEQLANAATNSIPIVDSVAGADKPSSDESRTSKDDPPAKRYTEKQEELVHKILKCKDYYDILGVSRDASEDDLKKSYKKLALKLHPDKNNAPKADDAFKAVSRAYEILNDKSKRTRYDQLGEEGLSNHTHGDPFFRGGGGFEFDLFREMFGTNNPFGDGFGETVYYTPGGQSFVFRQPFRQFNARNPHHAQSFPPMFLVLFSIPVLFLLFSYLVMPSSPFSLHKTSAYSVRMQIIRNEVKIDYYVKSTFKEDYPNPSQHTSIETMVYKEYVEGLWERCSHDTFFRRVTRKNLPTSCQRYEKLTGRKVVR